MKISKLVLIVLFFTLKSHAQVMSFLSPVYNSAGVVNNKVNALSIDGNGNVFICGKRGDVMQFGPIALSASTGGAYFGKISSSGTPIWFTAGGTSSYSDEAFDIAVDATDNVYICGSIFGPSAATFSGTTLTSGSTGFVAKYDNNGSLIWVEGYPAYIYSICLDNAGVPFVNSGDGSILKLSAADGSVITSGTLGGNLMNPKYHNVQADHFNNIFAQAGNKIIKFDNDLIQQWSTPVTASLAETFRLSLDQAGNVYSSFYALFGTVTVGTITKSDFPNGYIYKLDGATGTPLLVDSIRIGGQASKIKEILIPNSGDYYFVGDGAFNTPHVVRMTTAYSTVWDKTFPGTSTINNTKMAGFDCLFLGGSYYDAASFDNYVLPALGGLSGVTNSYATGLCLASDINENGVSSGTLVFPNPATDHFLLDSQMSITKVELISATGQRVPCELSGNKVNIVGVPAGIYTLLAQGKQTTLTARIIVQ